MESFLLWFKEEGHCRGYLLIEVEEEGREFLHSLEHLEVGGRLVPRAVQGEGVNDSVSTVSLSGITSDGLEVLGKLLNITLEGLKGLEALMTSVLRVKLETEEETLDDGPVGIGSGADFPVEGNSA